MTALNEFGLSDWTMDDLRSVFRQHPKVRKVILFGSRAKGNYRTGSDIDLALVGSDVDHEEMLHIYNDIDDLTASPYAHLWSRQHLPSHGRGLVSVRARRAGTWRILSDGDYIYLVEGDSAGPEAPASAYARMSYGGVTIMYLKDKVK
jgi:predicted nucleotidyltransferase